MSLPPFQTITTGLVVAIVGFFSSFPIVLQGVRQVGATDAQAASALAAAAIAMGLTGVFLALWKRQPISVAWSTPGVALLAVTATPESGFAGAIGAFILAGALTVIAGLWRPFARLAAAIPIPLAHAMLAGVLLKITMQPFQGIAEIPLLALPVVLTWIAARFIRPLFAVPAAVIAAAIVTLIHAGGATLPPTLVTPFLLIAPALDPGTAISIGIPLFIVTMATQNIPGVAVLRSNGYAPEAGHGFTAVGVASLLSASFGAPATCLAAITSAMCSGDEAHPDPALRYWAAVFAGLFYAVFGIFAGVITGFAGLAPTLLLGTLAGIALISVFIKSATAALTPEITREAAAITFVVTASGITILGLGAAVWGLVIGVLLHLLQTRLGRF
ncbi:benzoate/H(+) symporter BenE family transporter [Algicella marina]|uniref:Benzoate/H(+) symporter BenE family transporter n=1 Tax=Algicella marina TaxID=2683284 RepID=A0A6P1SWL0_9RHOB|nr:benzoate/H(+) symporter BenE family transporter [Algicella marina]QHQ34147.1 benzoate/H(+) symporter BenE family transporter [Algicella marina]